MPARSPFTSVTPGALDGHIGAGTHGQADIRGRECRSVVDSITRHRDYVARAAQPLHYGVLFLRQHLGLDIGNADCRGHRLRGVPVVAGQHETADALPAQPLER